MHVTLVRPMDWDENVAEGGPYYAHMFMSEKCMSFMDVLYFYVFMVGMHMSLWMGSTAYMY